MPLARHEFAVVDEHGNIVTDAQVEVRREIPGQPLAPLFSDRDGLVPVGNPFPVDEETGVAAFHVAGGAYRIRAFKTGFERIERYVGIGTASEFDAGETPSLVQNVDAGYALVFETGTSAPPGSGAIRFNHANLSLATVAYVSTVNAAGSDITDRLLELFDAESTVKDAIILTYAYDNRQASFQVDDVDAVGSPVEYVVLDVSQHNGETTFPAEAVNLQRERAGADGAGDVDGPNGGVTDGHAALFDGTSGKLIKSAGYTPVNKAGDTMTGPLNLVNGSTFLAASGSEGGELRLQKPLSGSTLGGDLNVDLFNDTLRIFEGGGSNRGVVLDISAQAASGGSTLLSTANGIAQGKHSIWIPATAMKARTTNGAAIGTAEMATNKNMFNTLDFDASTQEFSQFAIRMPKSWDEGTVTFAPVWSHNGGANFGVAFGLAGVAISNDDAGDVAFGTAQLSVDTGGTTNDIYEGPVSSAITIAGTPQPGDFVMFQINRTVADGGDTLTVDARLHGIILFMTINAGDDT